MSERLNPEASELIAFLDLETTGSDEQRDKIIEVGVVLANRDLRVVDDFELQILPPDIVSLIRDMPDEVYDMHTRTGLLDLVLTRGTDITLADRALADWLRSHHGKAHVALAGSGVSHFDRRFIKAQMPKTHKRLSYWAYDVGALRRLTQLFGIEVPEAEAAHDTTNHRALQDAYASLDETVAFRDVLRRHAIDSNALDSLLEQIA